MFLKQEKPEMYDFERNKNFGSKDKMAKQFLVDTCKNSTKYFAYSFVSEH